MTSESVPLRRYVVDACDGPFGSAIASEHYVDEGARVVRLGNIGSAQWRDGDAVFLDLEYWRSLSKHHAVAGDLVVAALGDEHNPVGRAVVLPDLGPALVKADCHRLRLDLQEADGRYMAYSLSSDRGRYEAVRMAEGSTRPRLTLGKTLALPVPALTLHVQRAIADYLDRETVRIDALIAAKRRMVELLEERHSEVATDLLLGPPVPGAPAGPGQVTLPPGWRLVPFRRLFREVDERSSSGSERLLSVSQTRGVIPQSELGDRRQYAETLVGYKLCHPGDLVVNRMWVYYGALGAASQAGMVSPDYAVFRPTAAVSSRFVAYVLRTSAYVGEMTRLVRGIGAAFQGAVRKPRLQPSELGLIRMPLSPPQEQHVLLDLLEEQSRATERRMSLLRRFDRAPTRTSPGPHNGGSGRTARHSRGGMSSISERLLEDEISGHLLSDGGYLRCKVGARLEHRADFDPRLGLDTAELLAFVGVTQPDAWGKLVKAHGGDEALSRQRFVQRLAQQLDERGTVDVLRHGVRDQNVEIRLSYRRPAYGVAPELVAHYDANRLTVTRQLPFDPDSTKTVDLCLFVNGIPVATAELKNHLTSQNIEHAIEQYRVDRDPKNVTLGRRALVHFAVDPDAVAMTTKSRVSRRGSCPSTSATT